MAHSTSRTLELVLAAVSSFGVISAAIIIPATACLGEQHPDGFAEVRPLKDGAFTELSDDLFGLHSIPRCGRIRFLSRPLPFLLRAARPRHCFLPTRLL